MSKPFNRANLMMAAIASIIGSGLAFAAQQSAISALGPYESKGKGKGGGNRVAAGAGMANHRRALKSRNVRRHRANA